MFSSIPRAMLPLQLETLPQRTGATQSIAMNGDNGYRHGQICQSYPCPRRGPQSCPRLVEARTWARK